MKRVTVKCSLFCSALVMASASLAAAPEPNTSEPPNGNRSIWTLNVTKDRKQHALLGGYTKKWDLGDLPHYAPKRQLKGTLRIWGSNYLKDGPLGGYWAKAFHKFQPGITIKYNVPTAGIAIPALAAKVADLGFGRPATLMDYLTFQQVFGYSPAEITAATGSYDVYGWSPAFIILVNKTNPLTRISMKQLDGVFGAARLGGYDGSVWRSDYPYRRGADENIRTWGQLGLTGEWANKPIHPCGQSPRANVQTVFSEKVLRGSDQWVDGYRAFANYATEEGKIYAWSLQVRHALEADPLSLCIASPLTIDANVRELTVQPYEGGAYVQRTLETVRNRTYPLINEVYFFANKAPGKALDPKVEEFLRFILSREGQFEVEREGRYTPLTADVVNAQLAKLLPDAKLRPMGK